MPIVRFQRHISRTNPVEFERLYDKRYTIRIKQYDSQNVRTGTQEGQKHVKTRKTRPGNRTNDLPSVFRVKK